MLGGRSRDTGSWCRFGGGKQDGCPQADQADEGQDDHGDPVGPAGVGEAIERAIRANAGLVAEAMMAAPGEAVAEE